MDRSTFGPLGVSLTISGDGTHTTRAAAMEGAGASTLWIAGGQLGSTDLLGEVAAATTEVLVGSAVAAIEVHDAPSLAAVHRGAPDRIVAGIGAQGPRPLPRLAAYLDELDGLGVGRDRRVLAALGPRKLELARDRSAGALALLVTPEYTAQARAVLGPDAVLVVHHFAVVDEDPATARAALRGPLEFLLGVPGYAENFRRMGFTDDDIADRSDRLVDATSAWGSADTVTARLREHLDAGADQVVVDETAFARGAGTGVIAAAR